jgi:hypothetical protein
MVMAGILLAVLGAATAALADGSLAAGLVNASDLPGVWASFAAPVLTETGHDLCGARYVGPSKPIEEASTAFAITPDNGPIFGERIERFRDEKSAKRSIAHDDGLKTPCRFTDQQGSRWQTDRLAPPRVGEEGSVLIVKSRDRNHSYNYEVAARSGLIVVRTVLNTRKPSRALLDELVAAAWAKAKSSDVI